MRIALFFLVSIFLFLPNSLGQNDEVEQQLNSESQLSETTPLLQALEEIASQNLTTCHFLLKQIQLGSEKTKSLESKEQAVMEFASNYTELVGEQLLPYYKMMPDLDETQNVEYNVDTVFLNKTFEESYANLSEAQNLQDLGKELREQAKLIMENPELDFKFAKKQLKLERNFHCAKELGAFLMKERPEFGSVKLLPVAVSLLAEVAMKREQLYDETQQGNESEEKTQAIEGEISQMESHAVNGSSMALYGALSDAKDEAVAFLIF